MGPAAAGLINAAGGTGSCFLINAASFVAVVLSLTWLDTSRLQPSPPAVRAPQTVARGLPVRPADARARRPAADDGAGLGLASATCLVAAIAGAFVLRRQASRQALVVEPPVRGSQVRDRRCYGAARVGGR
ncbi:MAG TPA: hypothetical protein VLR26_17345 [Frankiaceae bacterium]|nr:hypothetical protein [Frankiaceae bacterium]